jgi:hypothetical protein
MVRKIVLTSRLCSWLGAIVLEASHSSGSFISSLILCFVAFPETLRKAHSEIDNLLLDGRPPTMDDITSLPYIRAILREVISCLD